MPQRHSSEFEAVFRAHYADVLAFALRRSPDRSVADEVAAETFAVAWRRFDAMPADALPWLYGVARRILANQARSARRRERLRARLLSRGTGVGRDPADTLVARDEILVALARLRPSQREVLRLTAWEGLDIKRAASVLGCSTRAFSARLHRARRRLAQELDALDKAEEIGPAGHKGEESSQGPVTRAVREGSR